MRSFLVALICLCIATPARGLWSEKKCRAQVASLAEITQRVPELLVLRPYSRRYLIGSLIKTRQRRYLAVTGYRNQHQLIDVAFKKLKETGELKGKYFYEWLGEIQIRNPQAYSTVGKIVMANEVAGFSTELSTEEHENQVGNLVDRLERYWPSLLDKKLVTQTYAQSTHSGQFHLFPRMDEFIADLGNLNGTNSNSYRHFIRVRVTVLVENLTRILNDNATYPTAKDKKEALAARFSRELGWESMLLYLQWFENDGVRPRCVQRLRALIQEFRNHGGLTLTDWRELETEAVCFSDAFFDGEADRRNPLERVEILRLK